MHAYCKYLFNSCKESYMEHHKFLKDEYPYRKGTRSSIVINELRNNLTSLIGVIILKETDSINYFLRDQLIIKSYHIIKKEGPTF